MSTRLRKSELEAMPRTIKFFETLLRASADGIVITDASQNIVLVNEAFCAFFGQRWRDVIETNLFVWLEQLNANGLRRWAEMERRVRLEGACRDVEFRLQRPEPVKGQRPEPVKGRRPEPVERKHLSVNASLLEPVADEETGVIISIWRDITERVRAEETLRESEERYKSIFETVGSSIVMVDKDGHIVDINPHHVTNIGKGRVTRKDYLEHNILSHPSIVEAGLPGLYERVLQGDTIDKAGVYFPSTTGGMDGYFNVRGAPLLGEGQVVGAVFTHENITERVRAEEALQKAHDELEMRVEERTAELVQANEALRVEIAERVRAEEALRTSKETQDAILSTTDVLLAYLDKEFNFITVNQAYADAGRRCREDFIGKNHFDLYPHAENEKVFRKAVETGEAQFFSARPFEYPDQLERGTTWWNWSLIPSKDESGSVRALIFSLLDVTEWVRAEEALRGSEQNFRDVVENLLDGVAITDENAYYIYVNPKFSEITGYSKDELLNMTGWDLTQLQDRAKLEQRMKDRMAGKPHQKHYERIIVRKDGMKVFTEMSTTTTIWRGKKRPMAIVHDITERVRAEKQIHQSLAEKTTLLQELYHRTKNNMQVIYSMLALRSLYVQDEQLRTVLHDVQDKIHSMALVHQKLYESRSLSRVDLKEYIGDLAAYLVQSYQVQSNKISLALETDSVFVVIDTAIPCGLILSELISNALKHAFPGDKAGRISIRLHQAEDETITLEVSDNGIGVPGDFLKSDSLGLRTVLGIVKHQLHGEINVEKDNGVAWQIRFRDHYSPRV